MPRRSVVWLLTLPLAVAGSQVGHAVAYRLVTANKAERAHDLAATGHGYMAYTPAALAVCSVLVLMALAIELSHVVARRTTARPSRLAFSLLAPAIFICQEHFERLLHGGGLPWDAALQPTFAVGLLLQLPFAAGAYVLARLLLRVVRSLGRLLSGPPQSRVFGTPTPPAGVAIPRIAVLALGYGSRGPPARSR